PSALEAEQEAAVQRILSDGSWKISIPGATATNRDVSMLRPRQWMNDETITFYMTMINERSKKAAAERTAAKTPADRKKWGAFYRVHCFNSYFWAKLDTEGYQSVSRWTRRIDVFAQDLILIPCNLGNSHWTCAAINFRRKRVEYYDSMGGRNGRVVAALKDYLRRELKDKKKEGTVDVVPEEFGEYYGGEKSPQQRNGYDCGVFVCSTLEQLSRRDPHYPFDEDPEEEDEDEDSWEDDEGDDLGFNGHGNGGTAPSFSSGYQWNFSQDDMPYMRRRIIYEISQKGLLD
ncbi:cysteine proteinase, partial [Jaminaea rosea]